MANPNPQHVPTDGLGVAAYVQVTGTNITNTAGGQGKAQGTTGVGALGQGVGAGAPTSGVFPVAQYALTLSLSAATVNGVTYADTCQLTTVLKDVKNNTYTTANTANIVYKSYNDPAAGSPSWYRPSNGISGNGLLANQVAYNANVASVSSTGLITGLVKGQAVIEVQFPTFDDVMTPEDNTETGNPTMMVYCQILVTVIV